jgi:hypothetical protein
MVSRGVIRGRKIKGLMYIEDEFVPRLVELYVNKSATKSARN